MKTKAGWEASGLDLSKYLEIGDHVDSALYFYMLGVVPPAWQDGSLLQVGEPYSHIDGKPTYATLAKRLCNEWPGLRWEYRGNCHRGRTDPPEAST